MARTFPGRGAADVGGGTMKSGIGSWLLIIGALFISVFSALDGLGDMHQKQDEAIKALTSQIEALTAEAAELRAAQTCPEAETP